ncbi:ATP-binding protein [Actinomadura hibisca]|uniref:ATP-binding protein n=1 Tax=Actinomadura hibisca TaxID=68565 RepID=UPI0008336045|nr:ATP-binding protein [Actinomadura hibisca]
MEFGTPAGDSARTPRQGRAAPQHQAHDVPPLPSGSIRLAAEHESVGFGRRWLREKLTAHLGARHPATDDAVQALSEVLTNAICYGVGLHVLLSYQITAAHAVVMVCDQAASDGPRPRNRAAAEDAEGGRGLPLVAAYTESWDWDETPQGDVQVSFRVRLG